MAGRWWPVAPSALPLTLSIIGSLIPLLLLKNKGGWGYLYLVGLFAFLGFLASGQVYVTELPEHHISRYISDRPTNVEGQIVQGPEGRAGGAQLTLQAERINYPSGRVSVTGKVLIYVQGPVEGLRNGDRIRFMARLNRPENYRNPGSYDLEGALAEKGIYVRTGVNSQEWILLMGRPGLQGLWGMVEELRESVRRTVGMEPVPEKRGVMAALLLGEKGEIPASVWKSFVRAGVAHVLAISGLNIGIVGGLFFVLFRAVLRLSPRVIQGMGVRLPATLLSLIPVVAYSMVAAPAGYSLWRAAAMAGAFAVGLIIGRVRDTMDVLLFAGMAILVIYPEALFNTSFQLSFVSVASLLFLTPRIHPIIWRRDEAEGAVTLMARGWRYLSFAIAASLSAALGVAPLTSYYFNLFPGVAVLSNVVIVPLMGIGAVPALLIGAAFAPLWESGGAFLLAVASGLIGISLKIVGWSASLPAASVVVPTPSAIDLLLGYGLLTIYVSWGRLRYSRIILTVLCLVVLALWGYQYGRPLFFKQLEVSFIDVKHGDSALVRFPGGKMMLIDGGGSRDPAFDVGERVVGRYLFTRRVSRIDYVVATHPDIDHRGGLAHILKEFKVGELWGGFRSWPEDASRELLHIARERRVVVREVSSRSIPVNVGGVTVQVLSPPPEFQAPAKGGRDASFDNNRSVVLRLSMGDVGILLTGDIEAEAEAKLVASGTELKSQVLKVPHHGSRTSSSEMFIDAVAPTVAVISTGGRVPKGLPAKEVVSAYLERGVRPYRTDRDGAVTLMTDGKKVEVKGYVQESAQGRTLWLFGAALGGW